MHWIVRGATRAGLKGADSLFIPNDVSLVEAWEIGARTLGLTATELAEKLAPAFGLSVADLSQADAKALALLPERLARKYHVFPIRDDERHLVVATADPANLEVEHALGFASGRRPVFELATPAVIDEAIAAGYSADRVVEHLLSSVDAQIADAVRVVEEMEPESVAAQEVEAAPVVKLTNLILRDAVAQGASDVHIEPGHKGGVVRFRVDGVMRHYMHLPMVALNRVVSRIKVLGKLDITDRLRPQDGRTRIAVEGRYVDLRLSTVSTRDAEKAVVRILRPENAKRLDEVGITPRELARLRQLLSCRDGIVVVTGPTGSGKTTTLYSAIRELATGEVNIMTVEDPVEYELPGITQVQVETKRGITFANSLRALLRQDPDVIFVGEIRDKETAEIAVQAAMTGHLVLATVHANDAMAAVARLADLGLDRQSIASTLRGCIAQRLIRRVCPDCAQPLVGSLTEEEESLSTRYGVQPLSRAVGCKKCGNTGYRGRLPLVEVAVITPSIADLIAGGASATSLQRAAVSQGMAPLREVAVARIRRGETSLQEVERVLGDAAEDARRPAGQQPAILVVHQDASWRRMARALLENGGFRVVEAPDATTGMARAQAGEEFALVITDFNLPLAGETMAAAVRMTQTPRAPEAPIVAPTDATLPGISSELRRSSMEWARLSQSNRNEH